MGWLYVPGMDSRSAPASEDLSSDSRSPLETTTGAWVTSSGKPTLRPLSWRGWKTRPWIRRLSGTISKPSLANRSLEKWISSLPDSRASRGRSQASKKERKTNAGSGPALTESFAIYDRASCGWKTSLGFFGAASTLYLGLWPKWGLMRSGVVSERPTWAPRTRGSASSSSRFAGTAWLTPHGFQGGNGPDGNEFSTAVRKWPSPRSEDSESYGNHPGQQDSLTGVTAEWQTPKGVEGGNRSRGGSRKGELLLGGQATEWPTPRSITGGSETAERKKELGRKNSGGGDLQAEVEKWPTPASRDVKGANSKTHCEKTGTGRKPMDQLPNYVAFSPLARAIEKDGDKSSRPSPASHRRSSSPTLIEQQRNTAGRKRLSPFFVEWLMGWPIGWSGFAPVEMGSWLSSQRLLLLSLVDD